MNSKLSAFYKGKRVLVTGDTGFKGSWLALWLHKLGARVTGYALPPERKNDHFNLLKLGRLITHVNGDIRDLKDFKKVFDSAKPEIVFHLAAQAIVLKSYNDPKTTFDTNIGGSVNLLECVRNSGSVKSVVYITSDKCYMNKELTRGYSENDELGGKDPYSASKACAEIIYNSYHQSFFKNSKNIGVASARAGNVIGGGDWSQDRIIPDAIRAVSRNKPIVLRNPGSTRPWQHVLEPLSGYLLLAYLLYRDPVQYSSSWNFGPRFVSIKRVKDLAEAVVKYWGSGEIKINRNNRFLYEACLLRLNCRKANEILNWSPRWNFRQTVKKTVEWYKKVDEGSKVIDVSTEQINEYMEAQG